MRFYLKLALGNIKKNKKLYSSYFISTIFSITLYFIIKTVGNSPTLKGQDSITMFLNLGGYVIALFSLIFLLYTNSFVIKNRKKRNQSLSYIGNGKKKCAFYDVIRNYRYCSYFSCKWYCYWNASFANYICHYFKNHS